MIPPNELRIGNYVLALSPATLKDIPWEIRINNFELAQFYKPLPLTPEILEKCGFEPIKNGVGLRAFEGYVYISSLFDGKTLTLDIDGNRMPLHNIKYLHQLQNLYFALTGEELNVSL